MTTEIEIRLRPGPDGKLTFSLATGVRGRVVVERNKFLYAKRSLLRYPKNSALLLPGPLSGFEHPFSAVTSVNAEASAIPDAELVLVGHASPTGGKSTNDTLSQARADGLRAIFEKDEEAWVTIATDTGSLPELVGYFHYLTTSRGWALTTATPSPAISTSDAKPIVHRFQEQYNELLAGELAVDGECGKNTLGAVFQALLLDFEHARALRGGAQVALSSTTPVLAAGDELAKELPGVGSEAGAQFVDVLVMGAPFAAALTLERLYRDPMFRGKESQVAGAALGDMFVGELVLATDILFASRAETGVEFELEGSGGYRSTVTIEDGIENGGETDLHFSAVRKDQSYSLYCEYKSGTRLAVFESLSWGDMLHIKDSYDDVVDPFTGKGA